MIYILQKYMYHSKRKTTKRDLRQFGLLMGMIFVAIAVLYQWRKDNTVTTLYGVGALFVFLGIVAPMVLEGFYRLWMGLAEKMGFVANKIILSIFYFLIFTPWSVLRRLFNRDHLKLLWDRSATTYYVEKRLAEPRHHEWMF